MFVEWIMPRDKRRYQCDDEKSADYKKGIENILLLEIDFRDEHKEVEVEEEQHDTITDKIALGRTRENKVLFFRWVWKKKYRQYQKNDTTDYMPPQIFACAHDCGV